MMKPKSTYFYLHQNGSVIMKPGTVVDSIGELEYFNSPFVKRYWKITDEMSKEEVDKIYDEIKKVKGEI